MIVRKIKMTFSKVTKALAAATLVASFGFSSSASADAEPSGLGLWAYAAGEAIDDVMVYPRFVRGSGNGTAVFQVTIDENGDVIASRQIDRVHNTILNSAAKKVVRKADFPAIPVSAGRDTLTFELQLTYGAGGPETEMLRPGRVTSRQIAGNRSRSMASLRILPKNGE
jgi:TonB family protein